MIFVVAVAIPERRIQITCDSVAIWNQSHLGIPRATAGVNAEIDPVGPCVVATKEETTASVELSLAILAAKVTIALPGKLLDLGECCGRCVHGTPRL
jgi:hypothetical protein